MAESNPSTHSFPNIELYNTLSHQKEQFTTVVPGKVGMYLCGPTVYKPSHIGHMVGPVIFDTIKRHLVYSGWEVTWVVNITDVDDKLIAESKVRNMSMTALAEEMTADYLDNLFALGVQGIDTMPKATDHIEGIVKFIEGLVQKDCAYPADGDVYFDVAKDEDYGKLTNRSPEKMQGEGGATASRKRSAADFTLWKKAKPGEPSWESPWGPGRPGWHIECSAMSEAILGSHFDIHGGGLDLVFPHHENEIAQSESLHECPMATYWMHNGLMQAAGVAGKVGGRPRDGSDTPDDLAATKISKSTGAEPFKELLTRHRPEVIKLLLLSTHYRSPIHFGEEPLGESARALEAFERLFNRYERLCGNSYYTLTERNRHDGNIAISKFHGDIKEYASALRNRFLDAMDDDFNTAIAVATLFDLIRYINKFIDSESLEKKTTDSDLETLTHLMLLMRELTSNLGLFLTPPVQVAAGTDGKLLESLMQLIIELRSRARKTKDFATADLIRDSLNEADIQLEDRADGTDWSIT